MPTKLSPLEARFTAVLARFEVSASPELLAALAQAAKPERKTPAAKRDDTEEREVVAEFCKASGLVAPPELFSKPSTWLAMNWLAPVRRIINQCNGKSKVAIVEGVKAMRAARLTIAAPKSVEGCAKDWHAKQVGEAKPQSLTSSAVLL